MAGSKPKGALCIHGKAEFALNLVAQVTSIAAQMVISLFLTPVVLSKMGAEAYGFVGLVNNFVSYAAVITTALNSLAGRYITLAHHRGNRDAAETYFSSVFFADCFLAVVVLGLAVVLAANINNIAVVPDELLSDLQVMILLAFLNSAIGLVAVVFGIAAFIKNRLYLNSLAQLLQSVIRAALLCFLFLCIAPHMWYYSVSAVVASVAFTVAQVATTRRLTPEYRVRRSHFSLASVLEILKGGIWVSLESLNKIILTGLDLWISNLFLGAYQMGIFSVAKTVPNALLSMSSSFANLFYPKLAEHYAKREHDELRDGFSFAMRFTAGIMLVPLAGLIIYGIFFYRLWVPERSADEIAIIQLLSVLTVISLVASALVEPLYYANTLANRIRDSVLITLGFSLAALAIELSLLFFSSLDGLCVIAATSSVVMTVRHCIVQPVYAARVLGMRMRTFFRPLLRELAGLGIVLATFYALAQVLPFGSWGALLASCVLSALVGYTELIVVLLNPGERRRALNMILRRGRRA
jgi:O-antigen/teichoic acid export membrane protein